jgi:O-antigen/teichoic acid export membrane protein
MKIGERTINNAVFNAGSSIIPLVLSFIFWPYIVEALGDSSYGIFALVGTVIGYFALLDFGLGDAVVKYVAEYSGKKDAKRTGEVIGTALSVFMAAGLIGVLLILSIARVLAARLLKIPPDLVEVAYHSFCAAAIGFFFTMLLTLFTSITNGLNRYDISSCASAAMGIISTVGSVILLRQGFGLIHLVWLSVLLPLLVVLFYFMIIRHLIPGIPFRPAAQKESLKRILHFGMYAMLSRISSVISSQVSLLMIGAILDVAAVTYYVIPYTILNRLTNLLGRVSMVIFPAISELQGQNRQDTICELYLTSSRIMLSFATAFTVPMLIFGVRFLKLWMNPEFAERGGIVLLIITIGVFIAQCTSVPSYVVNGLGHPKISGLAAIANAVLFLVLMIPGAVYGGIIGVAAAETLSILIVVPFFVCYVNCKVLGLSLRKLVQESYLRPLLAGALVAVPLLLVPQEGIGNLFVLLAVMGAGSGLYFLAALLVGVYQQRERRVLKKYLIGIWLRIRKRRIK